MESAVATDRATNRKVVTVGLMAGGILIGIGVKVLLDSAAAIATGSIGRFFAMDFVHHGVPVLSGLAFFAFLQFNETVRTWGDEVVSELRKIVWPSREDTMRMTMVVCIMLVLSGLALGVLDLFSGKLLKWLLGLNIFGFLF